MNRFVPILFLAAFTTAAIAQTTPKAPATGSATPKTAASASMAAKPSTAKPATAATAPEPQSMPWIKLPPGVPRVAHGLVKMPFALRYEDIKVGTGAEGESGKLWHLKYTGWRAADGIKFDSWDDHKQPVIGSDGKPKLGPDGKPVMGDADADRDSAGHGPRHSRLRLRHRRHEDRRKAPHLHSLANGLRNPRHSRPSRATGSPASPGIPAKSDLIFDVELLDVTDMPMPPQRPMMPRNRPMPMQPHPGAGAQPNAAPTPKPAPPATQTAPSTSTPAQPAAPAQPTQPPTSTQTPAQPQQK